MIKQFTGLLTGLFLICSTSAIADDFDTSQHNFKLKQDKISLEYRETLDSDKDHLQLGYDISNNVTLEYRYVDADDIENRFRIKALHKWSDSLTVGSKIEYRSFQDADDHYRFIPIIRLSTGSLHGMNGYVNFEPRFNFGKQGESNDLGVDATQTKVGFDYNLTDTLTVGPFLQYETDGNFDKTDVFFGTAVSVNF